jgi:hypothetical protein
MLTVLGLNVFGDGLRDVLDVRRPAALTPSPDAAPVAAAPAARS